MDLIVAASHPIQYQVCVWRALQELGAIEFEVWYGSDYGVRPQKSAWGLSSFRWDTDLVSGYPHRFLRNWSPRPDPSTPFGKVSPTLPIRLAITRPRAILIQGYRNLHEHLAFLGGALSGARIIYRADTNIASVPRTGLRRFTPALIKEIYRHVDRFLTIGTANEAHYRSFDIAPDKFVRAPYCIDDVLFARRASELTPERDALRERLGLERDWQVVLYAGRLSPEKGVRTVVEAMRWAPKAHLLIAGSGEERVNAEEIARRTAPDRVHFAGFLNQSQLMEAYVACDVLCLPSVYEAWGLAANEALAMGRPVVVTDACGVAEEIIRHHAGEVAPSRDPEALAQALVKVLAALPEYAAGASRFTEQHRAILTARAIVAATNGG